MGKGVIADQSPLEALPALAVCFLFSTFGMLHAQGVTNVVCGASTGQVAWDLGSTGFKTRLRSESSCIFIASDGFKVILQYATCTGLRWGPLTRWRCSARCGFLANFRAYCGKTDCGSMGGLTLRQRQGRSTHGGIEGYNEHKHLDKNTNTAIKRVVGCRLPAKVLSSSRGYCIATSSRCCRPIVDCAVTHRKICSPTCQIVYFELGSGNEAVQKRVVRVGEA